MQQPSEFDGKLFFSAIGSTQNDVTTSIVEVKQRVETLVAHTRTLQEDQEALGEAVDLDLVWRMVSFLESHVMRLRDPSGEMRILVQAVRESFDDAKKKAKQIEALNNRIRRQLDPALVRAPPIVREKITSGDDVKAHFAAMESARARQNRQDFERKRRHSRALKMERAQLEMYKQQQEKEAHPHPVSPSPVSPPSRLKRLSWSSSSDGGQRAWADGGDDGSAKKGGGLRPSRSETAVQRRKNVNSRPQPNAAAPPSGGWLSLNRSNDDPELDIGTGLTVRRVSPSPSSSEGPSPNSSVGRRSGLRFGSHRADAPSLSLESLVSPGPSPPVSPGTAHRQKTLSSPLGLRKNQGAVAFQFGKSRAAALLATFHLSKCDLLFDQCEQGFRFDYAVVTVGSQMQVGWARVHGSEMHFFDQAEECVWKGPFERVFEDRRSSGDDLAVRTYKWRARDDPIPMIDVATTKTVSSFPVRVALRIAVRDAPQQPTRPVKPLPPRPDGTESSMPASPALSALSSRARAQSEKSVSPRPTGSAVAPAPFSRSSSSISRTSSARVVSQQQQLKTRSRSGSKGEIDDYDSSSSV